MQVITKLKLKMRTKHILTAMVLPTLFAACTADDFETVNVAGDSQRPMLSGVTLTTVDGADTRYAVEEGAAGLKFNYENGDQIGAAIIDQFDENNPKDPSKWDIIASQGGVCNPFTYDATAGTWTTINSIGVGHYIFVYPYNSTNIQRYAVNYELPVIQELYTDEEGDVDLNAAIEKGNMAIYSTLLEEKDLNVEAYMRNMFAYPTFRINIDNGEKVSTVSQVVLEYASKDNKGFIVKSGLNHKAVYAYFSDSDDETLNLCYDSDKKATDWEKVQTANLILDPETSDSKGYIAEGGEYSQYIIAKLPKGTEFQRDGNTDNKYVEVRFMIPGSLLEVTNNDVKGDYADALKMHIYTDNGIYTIDNVYDAIDFSKTTDNATKERVFARNSSYTLTLSKEAVEAGDDNYIVTTADDWNNLVSEYGNSKNYVDTPLKVQVIGGDFAFGTDTEMPEVAIFEVTTPVSVKSDVTLSNVIVSNDDKDNVLTVEEGATLTTSETFEADVIENNGTLNIAQVLDDKKKIVNYEGVASIVNNATLNIAEDAEATFALENDEDATVVNNGEININGSNKGLITNNGLMTTNGDFENEKPTYKDEKPEYEPTIVNNGEIRADKGELTNGYIIDNNGELTCRSLGGNIINNGEIDSAKDATTYITDNANGTIVVYTAIPNDDVVITNKNGVVAYTATEKEVKFKDGTTISIVNWVTVEDDLKIDDLTNIKTIEIADASLLTLPEKASVTTLIADADLTLASNLTANRLEVAENVAVEVNAGVTLKVNEMWNDGEINVAGTFEAAMSGEEDGEGEGDTTKAGIVKESGSNQAQVIWSESSVAIAKAKYEEALSAAVKAWANDSRSGIKLGVAQLGYDILNGVKSTGEDAIKAADLFEDYYEANKEEGKEDGGVTFEEQYKLSVAFEAYKKVNSSAKLLDSYTNAVNNLLTEDEDVKAFLEKVEAGSLSWTAPADKNAATARIYKDKKDAEGKTITAETQAIKAFKVAVISADIKFDNKYLTTLQGVVLCTSSDNYAPACSQVFTDSPIYLIFGEDAIAMTQDWTKAGLSRPCKTKDNVDGWGLENVKSWIEEVAASDSNSTFIKNARNYVETNDLISESKSWTYDDNIIKAIVADQEYNK